MRRSWRIARLVFLALLVCWGFFCEQAEQGAWAKKPEETGARCREAERAKHWGTALSCFCSLYLSPQSRDMDYLMDLAKVFEQAAQDGKAAQDEKSTQANPSTQGGAQKKAARGCVDLAYRYREQAIASYRAYLFEKQKEKKDALDVEAQQASRSMQRLVLQSQRIKLRFSPSKGEQLREIHLEGRGFRCRAMLTPSAQKNTPTQSAITTAFSWSCEDQKTERSPAARCIGRFLSEIRRPIVQQRGELEIASGCYQIQATTTDGRRFQQRILLKSEEGVVRDIPLAFPSSRPATKASSLQQKPASQRALIPETKPTKVAAILSDDLLKKQKQAEAEDRAVKRGLWIGAGVALGAGALSLGGGFFLVGLGQQEINEARRQAYLSTDWRIPYEQGIAKRDGGRVLFGISAGIALVAMGLGFFAYFWPQRPKSQQKNLFITPSKKTSILFQGSDLLPRHLSPKMTK